MGTSLSVIAEMLEELKYKDHLMKLF